MVKIFFNFLITLIVSIVLILIAELALWGIWKITKSHKLDTLYNNQISKNDPREKFQFNPYVDNPEDYLKIAIFGGSSAMGDGSEISLANVLDYELKKTIGSNIFIKNYATGGATFHKHQAEILKNLISHYDIFILHVGHNEWVNAYNANCGFDIFNIKIKNCKEIPQSIQSQISSVSDEIKNRFNLFKLLEKKSRVYAILSKIKYKFSKFITKNAPSNLNVGNSLFSNSGLNRANQTEKNKTLSDNEINKIYSSYQSDLLEVARLAERKNKIVIVIGTIGNLLWPPYFSKQHEKMSKSDVKSLDRKLNEAKKNLENKNFSKASNQISEILKISPNHSYANYLMGKLFKDLDDWDKSWIFLEKSVDEDGFPHRVLSKINILSNKISENFEDSLVYVDYPSIVKQLISSGYPYNKLFSDWIHPSILGHIIMGRSAVCNILKFQKLKSKESEDFCKILSVQDLEPMIESYKRTLNISLSDTIRSKKIIYRWAVLLSRVTAHPEDFYKIAEEHLYYMYPNFKTNQNDNLSILVLSALFQANQGEKCDNLKLLLNKALSISPSKVHDLLEDPFPFLKFPEGQLNIKQTFEKAGLRLDFSNSPQAKCSA